MDLWSCYL